MSKSSQTVRVRVAVLIDSEGAYSAFGGSRFEPTGAPQDLLEILEDEHENVRSHNVLSHVKFLEIDLPVPDARAMNLEAQSEQQEHPSMVVSDGPVLPEGD